MPAAKDTGLLTVAAVRKTKDGDQILFNERQQIFSLSTKLKSAKEVSASLKDSITKKQPVRAVLDPGKGVVEKIETPEAAEVAEFAKNRILVEKPSKSVAIDVDKIDPNAFNVVGHQLKWPAFLLCKKTIPNYAKAKEIFDFCAKQGCYLPGPYNISPCIPFQYVRDGCYARAHKMRKIITEKYGYCCEKVFSFANQGHDTLAVKADKWGGCCVFWWYHVAPLVRVNVRILRTTHVTAMVIDPGMFNNPVPLSTWLSAQKNKTCSPNANVSMYSIQPGTAYWPANHAGTSFGTDPTYTSTDYYLNLYKNLKTC